MGGGQVVPAPPYTFKRGGGGLRGYPPLYFLTQCINHNLALKYIASLKPNLQKLSGGVPLGPPPPPEFQLH